MNYFRFMIFKRKLSLFALGFWQNSKKRNDLLLGLAISKILSKFLKRLKVDDQSLFLKNSLRNIAWSNHASVFIEKEDSQNEVFSLLLLTSPSL